MRRLLFNAWVEVFPAKALYNTTQDAMTVLEAQLGTHPEFVFPYQGAALRPPSSATW